MHAITGDCSKLVSHRGYEDVGDVTTIFMEIRSVFGPVKVHETTRKCNLPQKREYGMGVLLEEFSECAVLESPRR